MCRTSLPMSVPRSCERERKCLPRWYNFALFFKSVRIMGIFEGSIHKPEVNCSKKVFQMNTAISVVHFMCGILAGGAV